MRVEQFRDEALWETVIIDMDVRSWGVGRAYVMRRAGLCLSLKQEVYMKGLHRLGFPFSKIKSLSEV